MKLERFNLLCFCLKSKNNQPLGAFALEFELKLSLTTEENSLPLEKKNKKIIEKGSGNEK